MTTSAFPLALALTLFGTLAQAADSTGFDDATKFVPREGAAIYRAVCQGCHMPQGQGAIGAGAYPALAKNEKLEAAGYPIYLIINGQKAMPPLGTFLDDEQVVAVVTYIRTNFGNKFTEPVSADEAKAARP
jgi:mono/diheme cytochrome c family protein